MAAAKRVRRKAAQKPVERPVIKEPEDLRDYYHSPSIPARVDVALQFLRQTTTFLSHYGNATPELRQLDDDKVACGREALEVVRLYLVGR